MNRLVSVFVFIVIITVVNAHSWLQCADYSEENGRTWDAKKCRAYPRDYVNKFQWAGYTWGADVGMNYQPQEGQACQSGNAYSTAYPAAKYQVGQKVCLAWPPKNHVAASCDNQNIPDSGTWVYRSGLNPTSDPSLSAFRSNLVHDFGKNTQAGAGVGFQNCPEFCSNRDKALCTNCFTIPSNLQNGKYTFMWLWAFNGPADLYSTCFDVEIVQNSGNTITSLPHIGPDAYFSSTSSTPSSSSANTNGNTGNTNTNTNTGNNGNTNTGNNNGNTNTGNNNGNTNTGNNNGNTNTGNNNGNTNTGNTGNNNGNTNTGNSNSGTPVDPANPTMLPTTPDGTPTCTNGNSCVPGSMRCNCTVVGGCAPGLTCASNLCVFLPSL